MSKLAIQGLLAITATLWLAQPAQTSRSTWSGGESIEWIGDNESAGESSRAGLNSPAKPDGSEIG